MELNISIHELAKQKRDLECLRMYSDILKEEMKLFSIIMEDKEGDVNKKMETYEELMKLKSDILRCIISD